MQIFLGPLGLALQRVVPLTTQILLALKLLLLFIYRGVMLHFSKRFIYGGFQKIVFHEELFISFFFNS